MGKTIEKIAIDRGHKVPLIIDLNNQDDLNTENLKNIDVAIEFTTPATAINNIRKCFATNTPVVVGTTGWLNSLPELSKECDEKNQTLFYASNFSVGVNIFFALNKKLAQLMNPHIEYEVEMEEVHHTEKLDTPSGTAITLAEGTLENLDSKSGWINTHTEGDKLGIVSKREANVPGTHTVRYFNEIDEIKITHTAHNRQGFALGAVIAAEWATTRKGVFTMTDMLDL
jgi:4-hydroxy-tetrahydrodipicolinate reductase